MSATVAQSAAPLNAILVWCDDNNVYAEVPSLNQPAVLAFPISEGGLSKCLALLGARYSLEGHGETYSRPVVVPKKLLADGITPLDMASASETLRRLGMLK
jgi:hypothetical protein